MYFILITRISLDKKAIMSNIRTLLYHKYSAYEKSNTHSYHCMHPMSAYNFCHDARSGRKIHTNIGRNSF